MPANAMNFVDISEYIADIDDALDDLAQVWNMSEPDSEDAKEIEEEIICKVRDRAILRALLDKELLKIKDNFQYD